jgi:hypothetical protein
MDRGEVMPTAEQTAQAQQFRQAYKSANLLERFNETEVPKDLWRGMKNSRFSELNGDMERVKAESLEPRIERTILTADGKVAFRSVDVEIDMSRGTPWVLGCSTMRGGGKHWGISLFDRTLSYALNDSWKHLKLPAGTPIPEPLVVTQDAAKQGKSNHYTIAPKWDMPLGLYMEWLSFMARYVTTWTNL